jgi:hypothetical protein
MALGEQAAEVEDIIARAAPLPLYDAAFDLWRQMSRLDSLDGRPTDAQVRAYRAMTPEQWHERYKYEREHAYEGPMYGYLKRAHPRASEADLKQAIIEAVKFSDDCSHYFKWDGDFWACVVRAVAQAQNKHPFYLDRTYRDARNHLAYLMK